MVKNFKRLFAASFMVFAFISTAAFADSCDITGASGLTAAQVQQLKTNCEKMKLDTVSSVPEQASSVTPKKLSEWAQASKGFADAIGIAAKEMGIAVNDFIKSPAGMITVLIILWKVMGSFFVGLFMLFFVNIVGFRMMRFVTQEQMTDENDKPMFTEKGKPLMIHRPLTWNYFNNKGESTQDGNVWAICIFILMCIGSLIAFIIM